MRRFCLSCLATTVVAGWLGTASVQADDGVFKLLSHAPTAGAAVQATPVRWGWGGYGYRSYYRPYYGGYYRPYYRGYYRPYYGGYDGYYGGYGYRPGIGIGFGIY